jgi:ubiquinone biosynthesis protein
MDFTGPIEARIRHTKRFADLLEVLARHGFASFLSETGLDRLLDKGRELLGGIIPGAEIESLPLPVRLRLVLEELGPTYIKLGQILSTRPDLIPPAIAEEFSKLQSDVPAVPIEEIRRAIEKEYLGQIPFTSIEEKPLGAGSIAQTHRAVLPDGSRVILKVLRPGIHELIESDVDVLTAAAGFSERHFKALSFHPTAVVKEFSRHLRRELDLTYEARSIHRLTTLFAANPAIHFPRVFEEYSTENILAMEEVKGILLAKMKDGDLTATERRKLVEHGTMAVFRMCLEFGFFHADPHPGNIFALPGGEICFVDLGMTGHIDQKTQNDLAGLVASVVDGNLDRVLRLVLSLTDGDPSFEFDRAFRSEAWEVITRFQAGSMEQLNIADLLTSIFDLLRRYHIQCPSDLVFLIKALVTIQGVGEEVDPDFDLVGHVQPLIRKVVQRQLGPTALRERFQRSLWGYLELFEGMPQELRTVGAELRRRNFSLRMQHEGLEELQTTVERSAKSISIAVILAAMIMGAALLSQGDSATGRLFAIIGFGAMVVAGVYAFHLSRGR